MMINQAIDGFLAGYFCTCRRSAKTQTAYRADLYQFREFIGAGVPFNSIQPIQLEGWAKELRDERYKSASIRRKFAAARVFFSYWVRRGAIDSSPLWKVRLDLAGESRLPRNLPPADAKRLIEQVWKGVEIDTPLSADLKAAEFLRLRNTAAVEILFATGIRVGELVNLTVQDWRDEDSSFLVNGKGSVQRLAFLPDERSARAVRAYLTRRIQFANGGNFLLVSASGKRFMTQGVARVISAVAKQAEISVRVTPHMIRHTVATLLLRYGADIRIVQEVLGHASINTTQRYIHVSKEHLRSVLLLRHPSHHLNIEVCGHVAHPGPE